MVFVNFGAYRSLDIHTEPDLTDILDVIDSSRKGINISKHLHIGYCITQ